MAKGQYNVSWREIMWVVRVWNFNQDTNPMFKISSAEVDDQDMFADKTTSNRVVIHLSKIAINRCFYIRLPTYELG